MKLPVWVWLAILALLILAIVAAAASNSADETETTGATTTSAVAPVDTSAAETTTVVETTAVETTIAETTVAETTAATTTTAAPTTTIAATTTTIPPAPIVFNGSGNDVVDIGAENTRFVLQASHDGTSNFQVELLDTALQPIDFPVNAIGPYTGTVVMSITNGRYLQVTADGNWSLQLIDASTLPVAGDTFNGAGDSVVLYNGTSGIFQITHDGQSNFQVVLHDVTTGAPTAFVVNEIGNYTGRNPIASGPVLVAVVADGNWTFAKS